MSEQSLVRPPKKLYQRFSGDRVTRLLGLIPRFPLVSKGEHIHAIARAIVTIQSDIARVSERDQELAQFGRLRVRPADLGTRFQERKFLFNRLTGPARRLGIFGRQEPPATLEALPGTRGDDYSWHAGRSVSASVPHVLSQARTSSPVRCSPVS